MFGNNEIVGQKYFDNNKRNLMITSMFLTLQGEGPYSGRRAYFIRLSKCNLNCQFCFLSDKIIDTPTGGKKLNSIKLGDKLWTLDNCLNLTTTTVVSTNQREVLQGDLINICYIDPLGKHREIYCTREHPFHIVSDKLDKYVVASDLEWGDSIYYMTTDKFTPNEKVLIIDSKPLSNIEFASIKNRPVKGEMDSRATVTNFGCKPYNSFLIDGLHVHNCDTFFDKGDLLDFEEMERHIIKDLKYINISEVVIVITGGEPLLQKNLWNFIEFLSKRHLDLTIQIETNGILNFEPKQYDNGCSVYIVVSPKCIEKNGIAIKYLEPRKNLLQNADCLKFVLSSDPKSPYNKIPDWALDCIPEIPVYVSPMNCYKKQPKKSGIGFEQRSKVDEVVSFFDDDLMDTKQNLKNHNFAAQYCIRNNTILSLQTHLFVNLP